MTVMKPIIYTECAASLLTPLLLVISCCSCIPPTSQGPQENTLKAKFTTAPNSFSGDGGYGKVYRALRGFSPSGGLLYETPLEDSEFTLHFEEYPSKMEPCVYRPNESFVRGGINAKTFKAEAEVISGKGKGCKRTILIIRGGWRFSLRAGPSQFTSKGGTSKVIGTMYITDSDGNVIREGSPCDSNLGFNVSGNPKGITVGFSAGTFTVTAGGPAIFELWTCADYGQPYLIEVKYGG